MLWTGILHGQPRSKANSRRMLKNRRTGKMFSAKNEDCLKYVEAVQAQALAGRPSRLLEGPLLVRGTLYYPSHRSDLDPSLLIDALQDIIFKNDRQVKRWEIGHGIDKEDPRAELYIEEMEPRPE